MIIKFYASTNLCGSRCEDSFEIDKEEWEEMTSREQEKMMFEIVCDSGIMEWGYEVDDKIA